MSQIKYEARAIKTFTGMEGIGFNASLYKIEGDKATKVAECIDDARGGELIVHWADQDKPYVEFERFEFNYETKKYGMQKVRGTQFEKEFEDYVNALPMYVFDGKERRHSVHTAVDDLVNLADAKKKLKALMKKKVVYQKDGKVYTTKAAPSEAALAKWIGQVSAWDGVTMVLNTADFDAASKVYYEACYR